MKTIQTLMVVLMAGSLLAQDRLDSNQMRSDLFAAMAGSPERLQNMLDASGKILARNPDHAQALLWHGAATLGGFFAEAQKGNVMAAMPAFGKAEAEMDRAVSLAPNDLEIRVVRAVLYAPASRHMPPPYSERLLEKTRADFQHTFDLQQEKLGELGTHPLGELLQGLGDTYSRQGKPADAEKYYRMIQTRLKSTEYARRADEWMRTKQPLPESQTQCIGCHTGAGK
jgi:tetratricopeptide (TPR) repeat protein